MAAQPKMEVVAAWSADSSGETKIRRCAADPRADMALAKAVAHGPVSNVSDGTGADTQAGMAKTPNAPGTKACVAETSSSEIAAETSMAEARAAARGHAHAPAANAASACLGGDGKRHG
jgi:hypothetical protein